jgi:hypothetical protein
LQAFTDVSKNCSLYELVLADLSALPDTIKVRMKYQTEVTDSLAAIKVENKNVLFSGETFWYPRNLNQDENVTMTVNTTDQVYAALDNKYMKFRQKDLQRTFTQDFIDPMDKPVNLSFRISELK